MSTMKHVFFLLASCWCVYSNAAPVISAASTTATTITISGTGFGASNPMVFWDDASTGFSVQNILSGVNVPVGATKLWKLNTNQFGTPFTYKEASTRAKKAEIVYHGEGHKNFLSTPNYTGSGAVYDTLYVSWWYKPSQDPGSEGGSNKFIRIWDDENGLGTRISWTQMHLTCSGGVIWGTWVGAPNVWHHHEFYVNLAQKKVVTKVDGKVIQDTNLCAKDPNFAAKPLFVELVGFDHGDTAYNSMVTEIDDIYIGNTQARVVISESSTWANSQKNEVLPIKSWANGSIEATLTTGVLRASSSLYAYVVDAAGNVNANGFKVNCPSCPIMKP